MSTEQPETEQIDPSINFNVNVLKLVPGDRVLLTMAENPGPDFLKGMVASLRERFVGVEFTIAVNVSDVAYESHDS